MLTILTKVQTVSTLSKSFAGKFTHIIYKGPNNVFPKYWLHFKTLVKQFHESILKSISPKPSVSTKALYSQHLLFLVWEITINLEYGS